MPTDNHNHPAAGVEDFLAAGELLDFDLAGFTVDEPSVSAAAAAIEEQRAALRDLDRFQYAANLPPGVLQQALHAAATEEGASVIDVETARLKRPGRLRPTVPFRLRATLTSAAAVLLVGVGAYAVVKIAKGGQTNSSSDATTAAREADSQQLTDAASDSESTGQAEIAPVTSGDPENDFGRSAEASASPPESGRPDGTDRSLSASSDSGPVTDRSAGSGPVRPKANWLRCAGDPRPIDECLRTPNS